MNCRRVDSLLSDHLEALLPPRQAGAVTAHLDGCPRCRQRREQLRAVGAALRRAEALSRPPDLLDGAIERWLTGEPTRPAAATRRSVRPAKASSGYPLGGRRALAMAAGGLAAAAVVAALFHRPPGSTGLLRRQMAASLSSSPWIKIRRPVGIGPSQLLAIPAPLRSVRVSPEGDSQDDALAAPRPADLNQPLSGGGRERPPMAGDLSYVNRNPAEAVDQWARLSPDERERVEARVRAAVRVRDDFITIPFPRLASLSDHPIAQAVDSYKREAAIVDPRLSHEVTCAFKATALSDLCDRLRADTSIQLSAGPSVADEKVTLFCEKLPLRDVMRQLSRPFGYTWLRSKKEGGAYRYELVQDLKSQLLEEELRNRDRNAALLALEQEMGRYRRYLDLSPDEARARAQSASPEEKKRLENLSSSGWGPIHIYFRLSPGALASLRSGQKLAFGMEGELAERLPGLVGDAGAQPLPSELRQGVLQSQRDRRVVMRDGRYWNAAADDPAGIPLTTVAEAQPIVILELHQSELGQFTFDGQSGFAIINQNAARKVTMGLSGQGPYASGWSPAVLQPDNREANARLAGDPTLRARVSFQPRPSCRAARAAADIRDAGDRSGPAVLGSKVTTADALEAIHQVTGRPVIGDSYTRLYQPEAAAIHNQILFEALNQVAGTMHLRWNKDGDWLQFRSSSFYNDRLKEVPNRLLARWAASRREHGVATLDDLLEIAQLSDAQLDTTDMAEGARECWGLAEWNLPRGHFQRPHLRYLAQLTPAQQQEATGPAGLAFTRMSLAQQQQFIGMITRMSMGPPPLQSLDEVAGATLRVAYTRPGEFQVQVAAAPGGHEREPVELALVRQPTRAAALQAARRLNPDVEPGEIVPTEPAVTLIYTFGDLHTKRSSVAVRATPGSSMGW